MRREKRAATKKRAVRKKAATKRSPGPRSMRERLSEKSPSKPSAVLDWFDAPENRPAKRFVELWLDMALKGESDWSVHRLVEELIDRYGYPFRACAGSIGRRLRSRYGEKYDVAMERAELARGNKRG